MGDPERSSSRRARRALAIGLVVSVALLALGGVAYDTWSKRRPPVRKTETVRDQSGRLLEVTSPIEPSEVDAEVVGSVLRLHAGPLAAWKELPIGDRLETQADSTVVFTGSDGAKETFTPAGNGTLTASGTSGLSLSESNGWYVLVDTAGRKHAFSQRSPFPLSIELKDGERLLLTFKPEGWLIRVQSLTRGAYSLRWTESGRVENVLDETTGTLWAYVYEPDGTVKSISVSRPVKDAHQ
jgi:hypothetical protein